MNALANCSSSFLDIFNAGAILIVLGLAALTRKPFVCKAEDTSEEIFLIRTIPINKPAPRTSETPEIEPIFDSLDTLALVIPAISGMIATTDFDREKMKMSAPTGFSLATEIADYLVRKNVPFAEAHEAAGACVALCEKLWHLRELKLHERMTQARDGCLETAGLLIQAIDKSASRTTQHMHPQLHELRRKEHFCEMMGA